ncbi:MAG: hypothetical protein P1U56_20755 [Saprospiraceae bacterium]|nr:hypothetical protein [Saprospiraceae bacterium]
MIDPKLLGTWNNTWKKTTEIRQFKLIQDASTLWMEIEDPTSEDNRIKRSKVKIYTSSPNSNKVVAYEVTFELEEMIAKMSINYNKGILIIACFHLYKEGNHATDYFTRQFYSKVGQH